jgi:hypothetical protein
MTYAKIFRKKIRMCERFGHLPESEGSRRFFHRLTTYYCRRCGALVARAKRSPS